MKPTTSVQLATAVSAAIGLIAWVVTSTTGLEVPPSIVAAASTLVVGVLGYIRRSAKVAAGAMATALVAVTVWALSLGGIEVPVDATASMTTLALFIFAWITTEFGGTATDGTP